MFGTLKTSSRRALLRTVLHLTGKGSRARVDLMNEIRRHRGGSLGVVHRQGEDWLIECGDHLIWCSSADHLIAAGLAKHGAWQRDDLNHAFDKLNELNLARRGWFIDVGANIGTHVVYASLRPEIERILAIEPGPENFDFIGRNARLNGIEDRVSMLQSAVSDQEGILHLEVNDTHQGKHIVRRTARANSIEVPSSTLDDILSRQRIQPDEIALVWIDVEWHEHAVFSGMGTVLDAKVPVFFEFARKSVKEDTRHEWRRSVERRYDRIFIVRPDGADEVSFETAFDQEFADLLIC